MSDKRPIDVAAFAAHPDDVEQTCGGTLIRMAEKGYRTAVVDLTAGEMGTRGTPERRVAEAESAQLRALLAIVAAEGSPYRSRPPTGRGHRQAAATI